MFKTLLTRHPIERVTGIAAGTLPTLAEISETFVYRVLTFKPTYPSNTSTRQVVFNEINSPHLPNYLKKNFFSDYGFLNFIISNDKPIDTLFELIKILSLSSENTNDLKTNCIKIKQKIDEAFVNLVKDFALLTTSTSWKHTHYKDGVLAGLGSIFYSLKYHDNIILFCKLFKSSFKDLIENELNNEIVGKNISYSFVSQVLLEVFPEKLNNYINSADSNQLPIIINLINKIEDPALKSQLHSHMIKIFIEKFKEGSRDEKEQALSYFYLLSFNETICSIRNKNNTVNKNENADLIKEMEIIDKTMESPPFSMPHKF